MMEKDPPPFCFARPLEDDILTWHYILRGPPGTPYAGVSRPTPYNAAPRRQH